MYNGLYNSYAHQTSLGW